MTNGSNITDEQINSIIKGKEQSKLKFTDFILQESEERNDISEGTKKHARSVVKKLEQYKIFYFDDLMVENIEKMQNDLQKTPMQSRINRIHSIIKAYINIAIRRDLFNYEKNPYLKITLPKNKYKERKYLTPDEPESIEKKHFEIERLETVKDLFLFSCYIRLPYIDCQDLTKENRIQMQM